MNFLTFRIAAGAGLEKRPVRPSAPTPIAARDAGDARWRIEAAGWMAGAIEEYRVSDSAGGWSGWRALTRLAPDGSIDPIHRYSLYAAQSGGIGGDVALQVRQTVGGVVSAASASFTVQGGVAARGAPALVASMADMTLTAGDPDAAIDLAAVFGHVGTLATRHALVSGPAGASLDADGRILRLSAAQPQDSTVVVVRADNRVPNGRDGVADPLATDGWHADIGGVRDAAFTLRIDAPVQIPDGEPGPLAGLSITPSDLVVDGYEGVVFRATGVPEDIYHRVEFTWDFGPTEDYEFDKLAADFPGDRSARHARGSIVGHVYLNDTGVSVERDVALTARVDGHVHRVRLSDAGQSGPITVRDPGRVFGSDPAGRWGTVWVGDPARYPGNTLIEKTQAFRAAALAGQVPGIDPADAAAADAAANRNAAFAAAGLSTFFHVDAELAIIARRSARDRPDGYRVLLQRGGVWDFYGADAVPDSPPGLQAARIAIMGATPAGRGRSYNMVDLRQIGAFGVGDRPRFEHLDVGVSATSMFTGTGQINTAQDAHFARHSHWGIEIRGSYNPARPNRSDLGEMDFTSAATAFGYGASNIPQRKVTIFDTVVTGMNKIVSTVGGWNHVVSNNRFTNWRDYAIFGQYVDSAFAGNDIRQPRGTKWRLDRNAAKNINPSDYPNYPDHGTRLNQAYRVGFHQNDVLHRGGWSGGQQPGIRAHVQYAQTAAEAENQINDPMARPHLSIAGNRVDSTGGTVNFGLENTENGVTPPVALTAEGNVHIASSLSGSASFMGAATGRIGIRNELFVLPVGAAVSGLTLVGVGANGAANTFTTLPLERLGPLDIYNLTLLASDTTISGAVTINVSPVFHLAPVDETRLSGRSFYNNWAPYIDPHLPAALRGLGPFTANADPNWIAVRDWIASNWQTAVRPLVTIGPRSNEALSIDNLLLDLTGSGATNEGDLTGGARLAANGAPVDGTAVQAATTGRMATLDYAGAVRGAAVSFGALEPGSTPSPQWRRPRLASPEWSAHWIDARGEAYSPAPGDVYGVDFFPGIVVTSPGEPPLDEDYITWVAERQVRGTGAFEPMDVDRARTGNTVEMETLGDGDVIRLKASALGHEAGPSVRTIEPLLIGRFKAPPPFVDVLVDHFESGVANDPLAPTLGAWTTRLGTGLRRTGAGLAYRGTSPAGAGATGGLNVLGDVVDTGVTEHSVEVEIETAGNVLYVIPIRYISDTEQVRVMFRASDNWLSVRQITGPGGTQFQEMLNTTIPAGLLAPGTRVRVETSGPAVTIHMNGVLVGEAPLTRYSAATRAGIGVNAAQDGRYRWAIIRGRL